MIITPQGTAPNQAASTTPNDAAKGARERAISTLLGGQNAPQQPVPNANNVSPEELGAIKAPPAAEEKLVPSHSSETAETKSETSESDKSKDPTLSSQYAILARKEKALRQDIQRFKAQQKAFSDQQRASQAPTQPAQPPSEDFKAKLQKDPLGVLSEMGFTWDDLTQRALNAPSPNELRLNQTIDKLTAKIEALESTQEGAKKSFEERQTQDYKQAIRQLTRDATNLVTSDPTFETIKATRSIGDVVELIERTFKQDGVIMSVEEAATAVEDYLVEEAFKLAKLKKIQDRLKPSTPDKASGTTATSQKQPPSSPQSQLKTLTNNVATSRKLTARERAILKFKGENI